MEACSISAGIRPREDTSKSSPIAHSRIALVVFFADPSEPLGGTTIWFSEFRRQSSNAQGIDISVLSPPRNRTADQSQADRTDFRGPAPSTFPSNDTVHHLSAVPIDHCG
jgi:hypothetical protein